MRDIDDKPADTSTSQPVPGFQKNADPNESKTGSRVRRPESLTPFSDNGKSKKSISDDNATQNPGGV